MAEQRRTRIRVPTRQVQGGFEFKFDTDSYDVKLHGILSQEEYTEVMERVNQTIKPSRSNQIDGALLIAGPLLVPLALWGLRHRGQTKKRKRLLRQAIQEFNETHPEHHMRWNRGGPESFLTIERRPREEAVLPPPPMPNSYSTPGVNHNHSSPPSMDTNQNTGNMVVAEAKLVV